MSTAASALPAFLRSFDLPEPGELRRVARVYVWGRWFVLSIATFAWLYPLNVDEVAYGPNVALAILLLRCAVLTLGARAYRRTRFVLTAHHTSGCLGQAKPVDNDDCSRSLRGSNPHYRGLF